jgi:hypothetical protein
MSSSFDKVEIAELTSKITFLVDSLTQITAQLCFTLKLPLTPSKQFIAFFSCQNRRSQLKIVAFTQLEVD